MKTDWISISAIIEDYIDTVGHEGELDITRLLKFANDGAERISSDEQLVHRIAMLRVKDYKAPLPDGFKYVIQAAYRLEPPDECKLIEQISQWKQDVLGSDCELEINLKCPNCHSESCSCDTNVVEVDVNRIYANAHPELYSNYMSHFYRKGGNTGRGITSTYSENFFLMKPTSNHFFNVPHHIGDCVNVSVDTEIEYHIEKPNIITNFKEGDILLSYISVHLDKDGYRFIPNEPIVFRAITQYIEERFAFIEYRKSKEQRDRIYWQQQVELSEKYIARARNQIQTPDFDEFWRFVQQHWSRLLPNYRWERNFNRTPKRTFRYPNQTYNTSGDYYKH